MKKLKKLLLLSCTAVVALGCAFAVGCKDDEESGIETETVTTEVTALTLSASELNVVVGDTARLTAWCTLEEGVEMQYAASDTNVISVDNDGYIIAKREGESTVTVTYGEQQKTCLVKVTFGGMSPLLQFEQIGETTTAAPISLALGGSLNLDASVWFNQKSYTDFEISYTTTGDIGEVTDGVFTSDKVGSGTITAVATWRGLSGETLATLQKTVNVNVVYSVAILTNAKDYTLYTVGEYGGETYATETAFIVKVDDNGEVTTADEISVIDGADIVEYDEADNVVRALKYGTATIQIEYTDGRNELHTRTVQIDVERPVKTHAERIEFASADGTLPLTDLFGEEVTLTEAWQDGKQITVSDNVLGGLTMSNDSVTKSTLLVYADNVGVQVDIDGYGKIIRSEQDLKVFDIEDNDGDHTTETGKQITGYFVLVNDIENDPTYDSSNMHTGLQYNKAIGETGRKPKWLSSTSTGFGGTFDGQGHTLAFDVYQAGLFGMLLNGAMIKNVSLEVNMTCETATMSATLAAMAPNTAISDEPKTSVIVDNVHVKIDDFRSVVNSKYTAGLIYYRTGGTKVLNTVVELGNVVCGTDAVASGALFAMDERKENQTAYINNVVVVSNTAMFMAMDENITQYTRNLKYVAFTDVQATGVEQDASTIVDERYTLGVAVGKLAVGQAIMYKGKTVASDGDNTNNVYCVEGASRYNSLALAVEAGKTTIGSWQISATGVTWNA